MLPRQSLQRAIRLSTIRNSPPTGSAGFARSARLLSTSQAHRAATSHDDHGHESHYDPPTGWLWGVPPGEKREKEGWEGIMMYGFFGSLLFGAVGYAYKPDTSIQTWALEEARRRLEKEGILPDPDQK